MRIVELQLDGPGARSIEFHPRITVVAGFGRAQRDRLLEAVTMLCDGEMPPTPAVVEARDLLVDATTRALEALSLDRGSDPVIGAGSEGLPASIASSLGQAVAHEAIARNAQLLAEAEARLEALIEEGDRRADSVQSARDAVKAAEAKVAEIREASTEAAGAQHAEEMAAARAAISEAERATAQAAAAVHSDAQALEDHDGSLARFDEARVRVDRAMEAVEAAERRLAEAPEPVHVEPAAEVPPLDLGPLDERISELRRQLTEIDDRFDAPPPDPSAVADALALFETVAHLLDEEVPADVEKGEQEVDLVEEAQHEVTGQGEEPEAAHEPEEPEEREEPEEPEAELPTELAEARRDVENARRILAEAQERARPLELDPEDHAALEAAHQAVNRAEEKVDRALSGPMAKRKLEKARLAEAEILQRLGLPSYGAFLMRASGLNVAHDADQAVHAARTRLRAAEARLVEVEAELGVGAPTGSSIVGVDQPVTDQIHPEVSEAVTAPEPVAAPSETVQPSAEEETALRARAALVLALEELGFDDAGDELVDLAHEVVTDLESQRGEQLRLADERHSVALALDAALAERHQAETEHAELLAAEVERPADERAEAERALAAARAELEAAEQELEEAASGTQRQRDRAHDMLARRRALEAARAEEQAARQRLIDIQAAIDAAQSGNQEQESLARRAVDDARALLDTAVAAVEELDERIDRARDERDAARSELIRVEELAQQQGGAGPVSAQDPGEELEVYVLSRLAAQRSVGRAGALPLVIDGVLDELDSVDRQPTLEVLERMARSIQMIVLTDDTAITRWAEELGINQALVVSS